jgi:diguanylate cyclase (GGDEF)-like protein
MTLPRASKPNTSLMVIDLDRFKEVNDSFGHAFGDVVLKEVTARWLDALGGGGHLARLGGDEFALLLPSAAAADALLIASRLRQALHEPFAIGGHEFEIGASIGVATWPDDAADAETLLSHADMAMYAAKQSGSGCLAYRAEHDRHNPDRLALVSELRRGIERGQLLLHFQPQLSFSTGEVVGVEALVRWMHPDRGLVPPDEFIPAAEQSGLIGPLSRWVLDSALRQAREFLDEGHPLQVAVNLSMRNLHDATLPSTIAEMLRRTRVDARWLKIEVTESALMSDPQRTRNVLTQLRDLGVRVSVDDFGTGYATLSYLKGLPADELKIDRAFVRHLGVDASDRAIVRATIGLAHDLGLQVVAEGIEDHASFQMLAAIGCDQAQGYLISRPLGHADLRAWLASRRTRDAVDLIAA